MEFDRVSSVYYFMSASISCVYFPEAQTSDFSNNHSVTCSIWENPLSISERINPPSCIKRKREKKKNK